MIQRRKVNSSRVNLIISAIFHSLLIAAVFFFAAREGMLGKKLRQITVTMVPKEKKPEPPKVKPPEPRPEPPKVAEVPKTVVAPPPPQMDVAPPPAVSEAPAAAPPPASLPAFVFAGGKDVQTTTNANAIYKTLVENALRAHWNRPDDIADDAYVAEVEVQVDPAGQLREAQWVRGSGDARWDATVQQAVTRTKAMSRPPPKGFPEKFLVRFDVEAAKTEPLFQASN